MTGVQTCALPICDNGGRARLPGDTQQCGHGFGWKYKNRTNPKTSRALPETVGWVGIHAPNKNHTEQVKCVHQSKNEEAEITY